VAQVALVGAGRWHWLGLAGVAATATLGPCLGFRSYRCFYITSCVGVAKHTAAVGLSMSVVWRVGVWWCFDGVRA
jgi:hypothetical protein